MDAKRYRKTSKMWSYFNCLNEDVAQCNTCNKKLRYKSSTSNLKKHLRQIHSDIFEGDADIHIPSYKVRVLRDSAEDGVEIDDLLDSNYEVLISDSEDRGMNDDDVHQNERTSNDQVNEMRNNLSGSSKYSTSRRSTQKPKTKSSETDGDEDEFYLLGKFICQQLQKLSKVNALLAQEEIQSVLTRYKIYELSSDEKSKMMPSNKL